MQTKIRIQSELNTHRGFKIICGAGIIGNFIMGPVILLKRLRGEVYAHHLQNTFLELLENLLTSATPHRYVVCARWSTPSFSIKC